jgi:hypothetical protein
LNETLLTSPIFYEDNEAFSIGERSTCKNDLTQRQISAQIPTHHAQTHGKSENGWLKFA